MIAWTEPHGSMSQSHDATVRWTLTIAAVLLTMNLGSPRALGQSSTYTVLYNFSGGADGGSPHGGLVADSAGNVYGTATEGGISASCQGFGCGVVYELDTSANETVIHSFTGKSDGAYPYATLVRDTAGNFYGTTAYGGSAAAACASNQLPGCGVVFRVDPAGQQFLVLHSFGMSDGNNPSSLIRDGAGNLYGTTSSGGAFEQGVVFKLSASGKYSILHSFTGGSDGANPLASLIEDTVGNLYGTTFGGGNQGCGCGVVFKLDTAGNETVLHSFAGSAQGDGANPVAPLFQDSSGNLFGTTEYGGTSSGNGTVFEVDSSGVETVVFSFSGGTGGAYPDTGVIRGPFAETFGTTPYGGAHGDGVIFKLRPLYSEVVFYSFNGTEGANPTAPLLPGGAFYGTALTGGVYGAGVVFKLIVN